VGGPLAGASTLPQLGRLIRERSSRRHRDCVTQRHLVVEQAGTPQARPAPVDRRRGMHRVWIYSHGVRSTARSNDAKTRRVRRVLLLGSRRRERLPQRVGCRDGPRLRLRLNEPHVVQAIHRTPCSWSPQPPFAAQPNAFLACLIFPLRLPRPSPHRTVTPEGARTVEALNGGFPRQQQRPAERPVGLNGAGACHLDRLVCANTHPHPNTHTPTTYTSVQEGAHGCAFL